MTPPAGPTTEAAQKALADAAPAVYWLDRPDAPAPTPPLTGAVEADLVIVGAGYTGLWAARHALADEPARDVLVLDAGTAALGASGRNGGFLSASITHGAANGRAHFPDELATLHRLGNENYDALVGDLDALDIDAAFEPVGEIDVAVARWQADELPEHAALLRELGEDVELLDAEAVRAQVASPAFVGGVWTRSHVGLLPFPPEPLRWAAVQATRRALASADARDGRRGPWLRLLDRFGVGFDS
jgi:glycine/D-amino acid oxidase-like deaminating enzyme